MAASTPMMKGVKTACAGLGGRLGHTGTPGPPRPLIAHTLRPARSLANWYTLCVQWPPRIDADGREPAWGRRGDGRTGAEDRGPARAKRRASPGRPIVRCNRATSSPRQAPSRQSRPPAGRPGRRRPAVMTAACSGKPSPQSSSRSRALAASNWPPSLSSNGRPSFVLVHGCSRSGSRRTVRNSAAISAQFSNGR